MRQGNSKGILFKIWIPWSHNKSYQWRMIYCWIPCSLVALWFHIKCLWAGKLRYMLLLVPCPKLLVFLSNETGTKISVKVELWEWKTFVVEKYQWLNIYKQFTGMPCVSLLFFWRWFSNKLLPNNKRVSYAPTCLLNSSSPAKQTEDISWGCFWGNHPEHRYWKCKSLINVIIDHNDIIQCFFINYVQHFHAICDKISKSLPCIKESKCRVNKMFWMQHSLNMCSI